MFLTRTASSASLASIASYSTLRTTDSRRDPIVPGSSIGWSAPTTASTSLNVSAQVHFSFLASQYRQQSGSKGLGIASGTYGLRPAPGRSLSASLNEVPLSGTRDGIDTASSRASGSANPWQNDRPPKLEHNRKRKSGIHCSGEGSLRGYAERRIHEQRALEDVIEAATDPGKLKWEAKVSYCAS